MLKGIIIESSLKDKGILDSLAVVRTWQSGDWTLHEVRAAEADIHALAAALDHGPWYIHLWELGEDTVVVVFKDKVFRIKYSDKDTWVDAVAYGKSIGVPDAQLDFRID
jgi:hypothetical protein